MAFETGTATDWDDLITKLSTFLTANGWTQDDLDTANGEAAFSKGSVFVSFSWVVGDVQHVGVHQALGFTGGNSPGSHPDDSGNGYNGGSKTNANLSNSRVIHDIDDGPYSSYYFFENDSSPAYFHVVVEKETDVFRHFGAGELVKFGGSDWTGGEYAYGQYLEVATPSGNTNTWLLDGNHTDTAGTHEERAATLHAEGLPGQGASEKWLQVWGNDTDAGPLDTAGEAKQTCIGGARGSFVGRLFANFNAGNTSGLIPMYQINCFYLEPSSSNLYLLGHMQDVRGINMRQFAAKEEITIGSDTWVVFPLSQKTIQSTGNQTKNAGIAYKKVTA